MAYYDPTYPIDQLPDVVPDGWVIGHNAHRPTSRFFQKWEAPAHTNWMIVCNCPWAPQLGVHYRRVTADSARDRRCRTWQERLAGPGWVYAVTGVGVCRSLIKVGSTVLWSSPIPRAIEIYDGLSGRDYYGARNPMLWASRCVFSRNHEAEVHYRLAAYRVASGFPNCTSRECFKADLVTVLGIMERVTGDRPSPFPLTARLRDRPFMQVLAADEEQQRREKEAAKAAEEAAKDIEWQSPSGGGLRELARIVGNLAPSQSDLASRWITDAFIRPEGGPGYSIHWMTLWRDYDTGKLRDKFTGEPLMWWD